MSEQINTGIKMVGSNSFLQYTTHSNSTVELFNSVIMTAVSDDFKSYVASKALSGEDYSHIEKPEDLLKSEAGPRIRNLRKYNQNFLQLFTSRLVDDFQIYIVDILREIFQKQPRLLCTKDLSISTDYALSFASLDDLRDDLIETKINDLGYKGFSKLNEWCSSRGIPIEIGKGQEELLIELIATRNIITHNRCIVDKRFLSAVRGTGLAVGDLKKLSTDYFYSSQTLLDSVVRSTDEAICRKYSITTITLPSESDGQA